MIYSLLSYVIPVLLLTVAGIMMHRRLYREFPFFFTYLTTVVVAELIRFTLFHLKIVLLYFYIYWATEALEVMLGFLVLYEVFLIRLFPGFNITIIYRRLFPAMAIVVVGLTAWEFFHAPSTGPSRIVAIIGAATLALNFCQVAFLLFFGVLMWFMSREWRRYEVGIAGGFGIHAAVKLLVTSERARHSYFSTSIDQLPTISYLVAIGIWLFYLSRSDPQPEETPITDEMVQEADRSYQDIVHLLRSKRRR
jgi:hypothetical protein